MWNTFFGQFVACFLNMIMWQKSLINLLAYCDFVHLKYLLTYSMEQSRSWEANRFSASQEIPFI